jgi:hypothetical protein
MHPRYSENYVQKLFDEKDLGALHQVISVVSRDRELPNQFWLFNKMVEWEGATRSGIWQYYESIPRTEFDKIARGLVEAGLVELAEKYRGGMNTWNKDDRAVSFDKWIDANADSIRSQLLELVCEHLQTLKMLSSK